MTDFKLVVLNGELNSDPAKKRQTVSHMLQYIGLTHTHEPTNWLVILLTFHSFVVSSVSPSHFWIRSLYHTVCIN